jgi:siroheme synthase (precorrin-2 oxidase/ferrochelatase)
MRNEMLLLQGIKITAQPGFGLWKRMNYIPSFELHNLNTLIVGGGNVGLKSCLLLKSSPNAIVEVVAPRFLPELETLAASHGSVKLTYKVQSLDAS